MSSRASILIVGDDDLLSYTRAQILRDWDTATTVSSDAHRAILARAYDLVIVCQTVKDTTAQAIAAHAAETSAVVKILAIAEEGRDRRVEFSTAFTTQPSNPGLLREVVASLLEPECQLQ
jgi:CheY-like chemotaxis protein